ncbi:MAG TPA: hypothetical protein VEL05_07480 [Candidatus Acidoferrum sp.]|nr:hypothetical protein [Candidatus Acidoferrum sp.]
MRPRITTFALALTITLAAGCRGGDKPPDCQAVGAAYATLQQKEIEKPYAGSASAGAPGRGDDEKAKALSLLPVLKEAMVKECEEKKWTSEMRRCVALATTMDELERCQTRAEEEAGQPSSEEAGKLGPQPLPGAEKPDSPAR